MDNLKLRDLTLVRQLHNKIERKVLRLTKSHKMLLQSAVGIVVCNNHILLGVSKCNDERDGKWCFPGGGIDSGETVQAAAIREVYEEMGIPCSLVSNVVLVHPAKPLVGFCILTCSEIQDLSHNEEFTEAKWFPINSLPENTLSINLDILKTINLIK